MVQVNIVEVQEITLDPTMESLEEGFLSPQSGLGWINRLFHTLYATSMFGGTYTGETPVPHEGTHTGGTPVPHMPCGLAAGRHVVGTVTLHVRGIPGTYRLDYADAVCASGEYGLYTVRSGEPLTITVGP